MKPANERNNIMKDGIYFLHPEGSCWIGAEFRHGRQVGQIEQCNAATHAAANDSYAGVVPSDADVDVDLETAEAIVREVLGEDTCAEMVIVQRAGRPVWTDSVPRAVREYVAEHEDDDEHDDDELERMFRLAYGREPDAADREVGVWSLVVAACG